jgi:hypothetical protein
MMKFIEKAIRSRMRYTNGYWVYTFSNGGEITISGKSSSNPIKLLKDVDAFEEVVADIRGN